MQRKYFSGNRILDGAKCPGGETRWPREASSGRGDAAHFSGGDFDAVRAMIADDVRLDLASKTPINGKTEGRERRLGENARLRPGWLRQSWSSDQNYNSLPKAARTNYGARARAMGRRFSGEPKVQACCRPAISRTKNVI